MADKVMLRLVQQHDRDEQPSQWTVRREELSELELPDLLRLSATAALDALDLDVVVKLAGDDPDAAEAVARVLETFCELMLRTVPEQPRPRKRRAA